MKRILCFSLALILLFGLCACGSNEQTSTPTKPPILNPANDADIAKLSALYEGLTAHHGQLHDHSATDPNGDGGMTLAEWLKHMPEEGLEFAAILDHKQVTHMYDELWDPNKFIGGSEAMVNILDRVPGSNKYHYNMVFSDPKDMENFLKSIREFAFRDTTGTFVYFDTKSDRFLQLIQSIKDNNGFFCLAHVMQTSLPCDDPLNYYFCDETGFEIYIATGGISGAKFNYKVWTQLLSMGKRIWASAASDRHGAPNHESLSTFYSATTNSAELVSLLRTGTFVAGPVGIRMAIGDTLMGGQGDFKDQRVIFSVGDFHKDYLDPTHKYRVDLLDDNGVVFSQEISPEETTYFAIDASEDAKFYRVEVFDLTRYDNFPIAIGNPIWND